MGISISYLWYLSKQGMIAPRVRLLDIGSSYLYNLTAKDVLAFTVAHGSQPVSEKIAFDLAQRSGHVAGKDMLYLSELLEHTDIEYVSYDVCPGHKTQLFDLNREELSEGAKGSFDLVLNFGTSEHVINQLNVFKTIHDALKIGGVAFHQSPSIGWVDHGYFAYHPRFYRDLQIANGYEEIDIWMSRTSQCAKPDIDFRDEERPLERSSQRPEEMPDILPCCNLNAVYRKVADTPFRVSLELSTAHSGLSSEIRAIHVEDPVVHQARAADLMASLMKRGAARLGFGR
ncbi:methyltransferase domain-containing protein [Bradyrhizobium sp. JR18.2]|uniref:methyltransferase domain-containing protein n=1 Tax=Bradyrhizobium sp. JR18.2 TaxID=3156369 RepID=UPI0033957637